MRQYMKEWKNLFSEYGIKAVLSAFFGGIVYGTLFFLPLFLILIEGLIVYMYLLYTIVILIIVSTIAYLTVIQKLAKKALILKKEATVTNLKHLFFMNMMIINSVALLIGLLFIFVLIPALWA